MRKLELGMIAALLLVGLGAAAATNRSAAQASHVGPLSGAVPLAWTGDCFLRCQELCARCERNGRSSATIGHFCSEDGDGWKACVGRTESPPRCKDPKFLSQCD